MSMTFAEKYKKTVGKVICADFGTTGSGFFVDDAGLFLTNNHVVTKTSVDNTGAITLNYSKEVYVMTNDKTYKAMIVINEESDKPYVYDYAILKVNGVGTEPISIGDPSNVKQGERAIAIGYPSGFNVPIVTAGVICAILSRPSHRNALHSLQTFLTDTLVTYGSSGGPLVREFDGTVVGMVAMPHEIKNALKERLEAHILSGDSTVTPPIRDLINYVLTFLQVGYNHAISIEYAILDDVLQDEGGGP